MKTSLKFLILAIGLLTSANAQSSKIQNIASSLWNDETFVKEFIGSYGFLTGYEPEISSEEKETLRSLVDLIKTNPDAAIRQLEAEITPESSAAFDFILANLYFQDGKLSSARINYNRAIAKYPNFRRAYKNLGLVQVQLGDYSKSITALSKAVELGAADGNTYGLLGYGYLTESRYYPAEVAYRQAILMQPDNRDWKLGLAQCLLEAERYPDAIALLDGLIKDDPDNADYWLLQSNAYLGNDKTLAAAKNIEMVRRMGKARLDSLTLLGDIYMQRETIDLALEAYLAAADLATEDDSKALIRAAELLTRTGNYEQAITMIQKCRSVLAQDLGEKEDLRLLTLEAKIARANGEADKAAQILTQIIKRDALNGAAIIELGNYYADQGDLAKAVNRFEQAEKIEGFKRDALIAHAQALVQNKEYKNALPLLRRALQIQQDQNIADYTERVERAAKAQR